MRFRVHSSAIFLAVASTRLLGLPANAQAAPLKPQGFARVSVDGGTATTKEIGKHRYRITKPA